MSDDRAAAYLAEVQNRADYVTASAALGVGANENARRSAADVPALLAAVEAVLARHKPGARRAEIHTLEGGWRRVTACAGCEEPWPCTDYRAISAELPGEAVDRG